jgi:hypothetical protein
MRLRKKQNHELSKIVSTEKFTCGVQTISNDCSTLMQSLLRVQNRLTDKQINR